MRRPSVRTLRAVLLAALLVLAGCNGLGLSGGADEGETPSADADALTAAPVPSTAQATGTATVAPDTPPGVNATGIADVEALASAHRSVLANRSFAVTVRSTGDRRRSAPDSYTVRVGNGSREGDLAAEPPIPGLSHLGRAHYLVTTDGDAMPLVYADGDAQFARDFAVVDGDVVVESDRVTMVPPDRVRPAGYGLNQLPEAAADVTRVRRDGETFVRVHVTDRGIDFENYTRPIAPVGGVSNYSLTAYVRDDGFVKTIDLRYDVRTDGDRTRVERRWSYALDTGPLAEPRWVARTRNGNLSAFSAGEYPPGIDESGIREFGDLWGAHRTLLATRSFTLTRSGSQAWGRLPQWTTVTVENRTRFSRQPWNGSDCYGDRAGYYVRDREGGVAVQSPRTYWVDHSVAHGRQWLRGSNSSVERTERNGTTRFRLAVERPPPGIDLAPENFTATATVRPDGLITEIRVEATVPGVTQADGTGYAWVDVAYRYRYHDIGSTAVTEPDWVTRVKANRTATPTP
jgi:hypothetical protein